MLGCSFIYVPTMVVFLLDAGLTLKEVFLLKSFLAVVFIVLEIPSGYFADVYGRRAALLLGGVGCFLSMLTYCFASSISGFLLGEFLLGVGWSMISGADSALVYDTLLSLDKVSEYRKLQGRLISAAGFAEAFGGLLGGLLASISLRAPFIAQSVLYFILIFIAYTLVEPKRENILSGKEKVREIMAAVKFTLLDNKQIKWLAIYSAVSGCATFAIVWFSQPYMKHIGVPLAWFGVVWMFLHIWLGVVAYFAVGIEEFFGKTRIFSILVVLVAIAYFSIAWVDAIWGVALLFIFYFVRGTRTPLLRDHINKLTTSDIRATVLSTSNFVMKLLFALTSPIIGWFADLYSLQTALFASGVLYLISGLIAVFYLKRHKVLES